MAFDPDEAILLNGRSITKGGVFNRVKGLGWNTHAFSQLQDAEILKVFNERLTPTQMGKTLEAVFQPQENGMIDLNADIGDVPELMGPPGAVSREDPPSNSDSTIGESGVRITSIAPSTLAQKSLRPTDPTKPAQMAPTQMAPVQAPVVVRSITVKPPRTDRMKLQSMLDAAHALAGNEATVNTAKVLITTNGLERAFQSLYPELAVKVLGRIETSPDAKCRGGVVLDIELESDTGYVHIITTAGTITFTGHSLVHKGADA